MNDRQFWKVVKTLNWNSTGDDHAVIEPAVELLSKTSDEEIFEFEELLAKKLYELDTKNHAKEIGEDAYVDDESHFSVDWFLYARCVIVANGKDLYEQVLKNPRAFPKDLEFEALLYIARNAYERKNNKEWNYCSPTSYETYQNEKGWK